MLLLTQSIVAQAEASLAEPVVMYEMVGVWWAVELPKGEGETVEVKRDLRSRRFMDWKVSQRGVRLAYWDGAPPIESPDGRALAYLACDPAEHAGGRYRTIVVRDLDSEAGVCVTESWLEGRILAWFPGPRDLLASRNGGPGLQPELLVVDSKTRRAQSFADQSLDASAIPHRLEDGRLCYVRATPSGWEVVVLRPGASGPDVIRSGFKVRPRAVRPDSKGAHCWVLSEAEVLCVAMSSGEVTNALPIEELIGAFENAVIRAWSWSGDGRRCALTFDMQHDVILSADAGLPAASHVVALDVSQGKCTRSHRLEPDPRRRVGRVHFRKWAELELK